MSITQYLDTLILGLAMTMQLPETTFAIGGLTADSRSIAIRLMPSTSSHYYAGDRGRRVAFQALVKDQKQKDTVNLIDELTEALTSMDATIYTEPSYLQDDEQGYIYTASFYADLN